MMLPFAISGIVGDQIYILALKEREPLYFKLAAKIFPFDKEVLASEALIYSRNKIVDVKVYIALKDALYYDPYSIEMLSAFAQYAKIFGNKNEALMTLHKLKIIAPNSNTVKQITAILKD